MDLMDQTMLKGAGMDNGAPGNSILNGIAGAQTFNAATLEFDFVPFSDNRPI